MKQFLFNVSLLALGWLHGVCFVLVNSKSADYGDISSAINLVLFFILIGIFIYLNGTRNSWEKKIRERQSEIIKKINENEITDLYKKNSMTFHDINKAVHNLHSIAKSILKNIESTNQSVKENVEMSLDEIVRINQICRNNLDVSVKLSQNKTQNNINEIISLVLKIMANTLKNKSVRHSLKLAKTLPEIICNLDEFKQVFMNLIMNSIEAMPLGGTLTIHTRQEADQILINFVDSGVGVPQDLKTKIFKTFFTTKNTQGGTGLGLAVCNSLLKNYKGRIELVRSSEQETNFEVSIPIQVNLEKKDPLTPIAVPPEISIF